MEGGGIDQYDTILLNISTGANDIHKERGYTDQQCIESPLSKSGLHTFSNFCQHALENKFQKASKLTGDFEFY